MILVIGATELPPTLREARLGLILKRPSYRPTGAHPSPRSVSVWRSVIRIGSLSSTGMPTLCTHSSLTGTAATRHWVVTRGSRWLAHAPPYSGTVRGKASICVAMMAPMPKQESVSLVTMKTIAATVTPESGLVQEGTMTTPTRVATRLHTRQIMGTNTSKPWDTSWFSDKNCLCFFWSHFVQKNARSFVKNPSEQIKSADGNKCVIIHGVLHQVLIYIVAFRFCSVFVLLAGRYWGKNVTVTKLKK